MTTHKEKKGKVKKAVTVDETWGDPMSYPVFSKKRNDASVL
jgi:hypothetical protein